MNQEFLTIPGPYKKARFGESGRRSRGICSGNVFYSRGGNFARDLMTTTSTFPDSGKPMLTAKFADKFKVWLKCSSCGFFMGMSDDDWHHMVNSPNINQKIRKMAGKKE